MAYNAEVPYILDLELEKKEILSRYRTLLRALKGKLEKGDLGLIEVKDFVSFAAVKYAKVAPLLKNIKDEKMKGKKYKIEVARDVVKNALENQ